MGARVTVITPVRAMTPRDVKLLGKAIQSVKAQVFKDWEMIIVNDHSKESLRSLAPHFKDERITGVGAKKRGVCHARNQAVQAAQSQLLMPLDADDALPPSSLRDLVGAYEPDRIIYGSTKIVLQDGQRVQKAQPYRFGRLLRSLLMPVGSLHAKSDWKKAGGWNPLMEKGLEDWEYWISLGELGVCGKAIAPVTYIYNRRDRSNSRIARVHSSPGGRTKQYHVMRQLHIDTFNGRRPVGCCGGGKAAAMPSVAKTRSVLAKQSLEVPLEAVGDGELVKVKYTGVAIDFGIVGNVSGFRYTIPGPGQLLEITADGRKGVDKRDVPHLRRINRGRDFKVVR